MEFLKKPPDCITKKYYGTRKKELVCYVIKLIMAGRVFD